MGLPVSEGSVDVGLHLKSQVLTKKITSERVSFQSMRSIPAQEVAEGLKGLLNLPTYRFWKTVPKRQKNKILKPTKTEDSNSLLIREGTISFVCEA